MSNPFDLTDTETYLRWRERKLAHAIVDTDELIVEVKNPNAITAVEHAELLSCCRRSNMVIYATRAEMDELSLQRFAAQLGLTHLDANWLAGEQGITRITVCHDDGQRQAYIPYTDRAIKWHTDGYYNPPERQIRGMVLHCAQSAGVGGENRVMDHEIAYLMLRDANAEFIRALSAPDAMTIPERVDATDGVRPAQTGPVFSVNPASGALHMRYTARTRSIEWKQDEITRAAVAQLEQLLATQTPHIHSLRMEQGMGLLCNNVLHDRTAFTDDPAKPRLLYRARYLDRLTVS
jgi:alpha-ketoglutarate-dependent taurine dioxygenase